MANLLLHWIGFPMKTKLKMKKVGSLFIDSACTLGRKNWRSVIFVQMQASSRVFGNLADCAAPCWVFWQTKGVFFYMPPSAPL